MIKMIVSSFKDMNEKIKRVMKFGLFFALLISIISALILSVYILYNSSSTLYYIGIYTFKLSLIIGIGFIICGCVIDRVQNGY